MFAWISDKTKQKVDKNKTNQNMTVNRFDWSEEG